MQLFKRLGCLMALVLFAGATAFGDNTWFTTTIPTATGDGWTVPTTVGAWTVAGNVGTLKTAIDGTDELKFVASPAKTLPGDIATISTTVKFTAMDIEDLPEEIPDGAKGGLTVVEDSEGATSFYGIVGGQWEELSGDTTAALAGLVDVTVTIRKDGANAFVTYTVDGTTLGDGEQTALFDAATISTVSYKGNCQLSALDGSAAKSIFNLTVPTSIAGGGATIQSVTAGGTPVEGTAGVYAITSGSGAIQVTYAPAAGYMGSATWTADGLTGTTTIQESDITSTVGLIIAQIEGKGTYKSLTAAIEAAAAGDTITVVQNTADPIAIGKNLTIAANDTIALSGNVTISGAKLILAGGQYSGTFPSELTIAACELQGGFFAAFTKAQAEALCDVEAGYFVYGFEEGDYKSQVVKGEPITPTGAPQIKIDPAIIPPGATAAEWLAEEADNGLPRWQNYALGLNPEEASELPKVIQSDVAATKTTLTLDVNVEGNPGTGVDIVLKDGDNVLANEALPLVVGNHEIKIFLKKGDDLYEVANSAKTIGVQQPTVTSAEKTDLKLVSVPYNGLTASGAMTVDDLINKANLSDGNTISIPDESVNSTGYRTWTLSKGEWTGGGMAASAFVVKAGQGLWLKTAAENFFQFGEVRTGTSTIDLTDTWNLLGGTIDLSSIVGASKGDTIRVENVGGVVPTDYTYDGENWVTYQKGEAEKMVRGKKVTVVTTKEVTVTDPINPGANGMWYIKNGTGTTTVTLTTAASSNN